MGMCSDLGHQLVRDREVYGLRLEALYLLTTLSLPVVSHLGSGRKVEEGREVCLGAVPRALLSALCSLPLPPGPPLPAFPASPTSWTMGGAEMQKERLVLEFPDSMASLSVWIRNLHLGK